LDTFEKLRDKVVEFAGHATVTKNTPTEAACSN